MDRFEVVKRTGTHADVLAAVGAADVLQKLNPKLTDVGNTYDVRFREASIDDLDDGAGFKYLKADARMSLEGAEEDSEETSEGANKKKPKKPKSAPSVIPPEWVFDYSPQNEKYRRQQAAKKTQDKDIAESMAEDAPDSQFRAYRIVKALQGDSGPNKLIEEFLKHTEEEWKKLVWAGFQGESGFPCDAPLVQLFNPQSAKGYALVKPTGTDRNDKTKEKWAEPFIEWLRYRGFFAGCAGWFLGTKGEHVRVYCPIPRDISFETYKGVAAVFRAQSLVGSAPKMDCLGTLRLTRILIERAEPMAPPARRISGIWVTHYQSLGQAKAVTSIDQLAVPEWFEAATAQTWLETLNEHDTILRRLDDGISEELMLLKKYRRFLQQQEESALPEFLDFLSAYGQHIFRLRGQGKWLLPQFSAQRVEAILAGNYSYKDIIDNRGFQSVANALRAATMSAQTVKKNRGDYREIDYGILPELRRKLSLDSDDFIQAVSEFLARFNAESARRNAEGKSGFRVPEDDFAAFAELMDAAKASVVGSLLCAMATCKLSKEEKEEVVA
jgi:hypothetical protein